MKIVSALGSTAKRTVGFFRREIFLKLPLTALERRVPRDVVAFVYHVIADKPLPHIRHLYNYKTATEFEADVVYLKSRYQLPSWKEFIHNRGERYASGRPSAMLTFDDGMSQCFDYVRPILQKHQVPCIFFVTKQFVDNEHMFYRHKVSLCIERVNAGSRDEQTRLLRKLGQEFCIGEFSRCGFITWIKGFEIVNEAIIDHVCELLEIDVRTELNSRKPYMTSQQIQQLARDGFTIGGHSIRHGHLQLLGDAELEQEITDSCEYIQELVAAHDVPFAFPFLGNGLDRGLLGSIMQRHPSIKFMFDMAGLAADAPFIINRMSADEPAGVLSGRSGLEWETRSHYINCLQ